MKPYRIIPIITTIFLLGVGCQQPAKEKPIKESSKSIYTFEKGVSITHWADFLFEGRTFGDTLWYGEKDAEWIAKQGLDHVQIFLDGNEIADSLGNINLERIRVLDSAINWASKNKLGTILSLQLYPNFYLEPNISIKEQEEILIRKRKKFWQDLEEGLGHHKSSLRYNIAGEPRILSKISLKKYYQNIVPNSYDAIRSVNENRHVYITNYSIDKTDSLYLNKGLENISIAFKISGYQIFARQHGKPFWFPEELPLIRFPDTLPDLTDYFPKESPWIKLSQRNVDKQLIEHEISSFKEAVEKIGYGENELYLLDWGYYTGFPFDESTVQDEESIKNFVNAMKDVIKADKLKFSIYDYNSGMAINLDGNPSILMEEIK